jgi:hypothetical protein
MNTITNYSGTVRFTSSDPHAALPADYKFTPADQGVHHFAATLKTTGSRSITAAVSATGSGAGVRTVFVSPAAASTLLLLGLPSHTSAGAAQFFLTTAKDAYGNTASGYAGTVHFTSTDPKAALPADYTFTASDKGMHTFAVTWATVGSETITATDIAHGSITGKQSGVTVVSAGPAKALTLTGYPKTSTAGASESFVVTFKDAAGNVATGYTGTVQFASDDPRADLPADYTFTPADSGVHHFAVAFKTAGVHSISVIATGGITRTLSGITVNPAAASSFTIAGLPASLTAGATPGFTVIVRDAYGNIATNYAGKIQFRSDDPQAALPADYTFTANDMGMRAFHIVLKTAGVHSITASAAADGVTTSVSGIMINPAAARSFMIIGVPSLVMAGAAYSFTVIALDPYGNVATGYLGTVCFKSSDHHAALPADYTFNAADKGMHTFTVVFHSLGASDFELVVLDVAEHGVKGSARRIVVF